jgi:hypothetical protein
MDAVIGWVAAIGGAVLFFYIGYDVGIDAGRRKAALEMKCRSNSAYSIIDTRTGKCVNKK